MEVDMTGDWSFLNDILMEASGINLYKTRAFIDYNENENVSKLHGQVMLPNNIAVHAHCPRLFIEIQSLQRLDQ